MASNPLTSRGNTAGGVNPSGTPLALQVDEYGALIVTGSIQVGGITISGSIGASVAVSNFPAVQTITGSVGISGVTFPETINVAGTVAVSNFPAVQVVTGTVDVNTLQTIVGEVDIANWPAVQPVSIAISTSATTTNVTASLTSQVLLNVNSTRLGASFFNTRTSTGNAYLSLGTTASTGSFLVELTPGAYYSLDTRTQSAVSVVFDATPGNIMTTEES